MNTLLQLSAPPLLGAFIGYMTNYVAIKMLFRPLRPWKIAGIRVPMTPGVIPSKRHQLARNIGEMVGEHLLTSRDVSRAIAGDRFQQKLHELIADRVTSLLQKDLGPITTVIPERFQSYFQASVKIIRLRFISHMHAYLDSPDFARTIDKAVNNQLAGILEKKFSDLFPRENQDHFYLFLEKTVQDILAGQDVKDWIACQVKDKIDSTLHENRSLNDIVPPEITHLFLDQLEQEAPGLLEKVAAMLQEPAMQAKIAETISRAIGSFTSSLGPLAAMMASFIKPETIRNKVGEYLEEKGAEIGTWLADESIREETAKMLRDKADEFLTKPLSTLLSDIDRVKIDQISHEFSGRISDLVARPATATSVTNLLRQAFFSQSERPVATIIEDIFGPDAVDHGCKWTSAEVIKLFRSSKIKQLLNDLVIELVEKKLLAKPIGRPADLLPKDVQLSFAEYIQQQVGDILVREVPGLVDSLNIKKIVARKVDSLDLLRLEALLMSIMQEQFKYINLFGGLLGFLIGLLNLLLLQI